MSYFGKWECPSCKSTWVGSIGWDKPEGEQLKKMLHNICGCDGTIEDALTPEGSMSIMKFKHTKLSIEKRLERTMVRIQHDIDNSVNFDAEQHKDLLRKIEGFVGIIEKVEIKVPTKLLNWIDYLNGN